MATRLNVHSASREELIDVIRRLNTRVTGHADKEKQLQTEVASLKEQLAAAAAAASAAASPGGATSATSGGVGDYFSEKFSALTGRAPSATGGSSSPSQQQNTTTHSSSSSAAAVPNQTVDEFAAAKIASLETELEQERHRYQYDTEQMQQQIDELTIRAADDAEAIEKLRSAADEMKSLARQHEELQKEHSLVQRQSKQQHHNHRQQQSKGGGSEESVSVVDGVRASFANAMANLADERDSAVLKSRESRDDAAIVHLALDEKKREVCELREKLRQVSEERDSLAAKWGKGDDRVAAAKARARERYDRLFERFVLLKKRFQLEYVEGPAAAAAETPTAISSSLALPQHQSSRASSEASSSSSSRSSSSSSSTAEKTGGGSRTPQLASVATPAQQHQPQKKAIVFNAAQLIGDDDDDDDSRLNQHTAAAAAADVVIHTNTATAAAVVRQSGVAGLPSNTSFDGHHGEVVGFSPEEEHSPETTAADATKKHQSVEQQQPDFPSREDSSTSGRFRLAPLVQAEVQCDLLPLVETLPPAVVAATVVAAEKTDSETQYDLLHQTHVVVVEEETPRRQGNENAAVCSPEPTTPVSAASAPAAPTAVAASETNGNGQHHGSVAFEHDVQMLGTWDAEDLKTIQRMLRMHVF